jgi:hypothetical protein
MEFNPGLSLKEAQVLFYKSHGFPEDGGIGKDRWSPIGCRDLKVYLPNFEWRKKAIPFHDLHHIITGYPFSPTGEFQMSAWEFAAGRYPNIFTTVFCLPLVGMGAVCIPKRTFAAFVRGKRSKTLYTDFDYNALLAKSIEAVRKEVLPNGPAKATTGDYFEYFRLVSLSLLLMLTPAVVLFSLFKVIT